MQLTADQWLEVLTEVARLREELEQKKRVALPRRPLDRAGVVRGLDRTRSFAQQDWSFLEDLRTDLPVPVIELEPQHDPTSAIRMLASKEPERTTALERTIWVLKSGCAHGPQDHKKGCHGRDYHRGRRQPKVIQLDNTTIATWEHDGRRKHGGRFLDPDDRTPMSTVGLLPIVEMHVEREKPLVKQPAPRTELSTPSWWLRVLKARTESERRLKALMEAR